MVFVAGLVGYSLELLGMVPLLVLVRLGRGGRDVVVADTFIGN